MSKFSTHQSILGAQYRKFESEAALVSAAERYVTARVQRGTGLEKEFDCWHGIADLVIFRCANSNSPSGRRLDLISPRWGAALHSLPYRRLFTEDWFAKTNLISAKHARTVLNSYKGAGYCEPLATPCTWIKRYQPKPMANEICAVEAKLTDWRRALSQAARYLAFANQSWVLMDHATLKPALSKIELFSTLNVGLASISTNEKLHVWHRPVRQAPKDRWRYWAANVLLAQAIAKPSSDDNRR